MNVAVEAGRMAQAIGAGVARRYGLAVLSVAAAFALSRIFLYFELPQPFTAFALCAVAITFWFAGIAPGIVAVSLSLIARTSLFEPELRPLPRALYALTFVIYAALMTLVARQRNQLEKRVSERTLELTAANDELKEKIRELAAASATLQEAHADLARVNRVTTLGELTISLAHEVNQPIASAVTNANAALRWLAHQPPELDEARLALRRIVADGMRASDVIRRIRLVFTERAAPREPVDVNAVIGETVALLQNEAARHVVQMQVDLAPDLPRVLGDRVQLQQVVMNLMMNGIDAMTSVAGRRELAVRSRVAEDGGVLISVVDTGVGIPREKTDQIFDAFFTTKPRGLGMGLAVCRSIVESHGGRLWAGENPPPGAAFFVTLPAHRTRN